MVVVLGGRGGRGDAVALDFRAEGYLWAEERVFI